jgi:hypothetical protein
MRLMSVMEVLRQLDSGLPTIRSESATELLWQRFSHLQHGVAIVFVRKLTGNLPPPTEIETQTLSAVLAKYP